MALYTLLLEYDGGSYVSQVSQRSEQAAFADWLETLGKNGIGGYHAGEVARIFRNGVDLIPLSGLNEIWCCTADGPHGLALVNIVRTATES